MKINIYYGGRGIHGDPSLYVVKKMMQVLEELNVQVEKYDLFDQKNNITKLPKTLKEADGVILASTVEWHGVGGYLTSFLDACWLFGDKEKISGIYMAPVVMSTTYGEKEAELDLISAWEALGGQICNGICGYIPELGELEYNEAYQKLIEKSAENLYRCINQKQVRLPASTKAVSQSVYKTKQSFLTQQETEQLSEYISDDSYVRKQKEDIKELTNLFKGKLNVQTKEDVGSFLQQLRLAFHPAAEVHANYKIILQYADGSKSQNIVLKIDNAKLEAGTGDLAYPDFEITVSAENFGEITKGKRSFDQCFKEGKLRMKGEFKYLQLLDQLFVFADSK